MDIALLNVTVTFQKRTVESDAIGNQIETWKDDYTCAATISGEGGREVFIAASEVDKADMAVTVRWCTKAAAMNTTDFRIVFQGCAYDIEKIDHLSFRKRAIKFFCVKERT
ncbi:MAG: phage head closure protein [Atopobium minutum]|nr:phage head closure protein [Atopobium minutum]